MPGPNSLTFSNVGQHNQQHQREQELSMNAAGSHPKTTPLPKPAPVQLPADTTLPIGNGDKARPAPAPSRARRKSGPQQPPSIATQGTTQATSPPEPSPTVPQPKSAWPKDDDAKKAKASGIALSLREIQEVEAKKVETRKAAEKERERTARTPRLNSGSESHTITTSWGLSSSQAGAARNPTASRDALGSSTSPVTSATPVWTNPVAAQPTKKTMKEIQEEEERQKKYAVKETAAAAARRAYAETSTRVYDFA
jgi:PERQ amino acid-rich with GYF domain-containing protein